MSVPDYVYVSKVLVVCREDGTVVNQKKAG